MRYLLFLLTFAIFIFQGCTTRQASVEINTSQDQTINPSPDKIKKCIKCDEESHEFEDEFSEKETRNDIDPLYTYNKMMTSFNDTLITYALNPVSEAYATIMPQPIRVGISNVIDNIQFPVRLANNLLQGKFQNSSNELERFIINSTVGLGGLMDPATKYKHIPAHDEDFGQTLGHYGVGPGFHVVLPFFGPSNVRDILGIGIDAYISPLAYSKDWEKYRIPNNYDQSIVIITGHYVNKNSLHLGEYESLKKDAIELYPFLKDIYEQKRVTDISE